MTTMATAFAAARKNNGAVPVATALPKPFKIQIQPHTTLAFIDHMSRGNVMNYLGQANELVSTHRMDEVLHANQIVGRVLIMLHLHGADPTRALREAMTLLGVSGIKVGNKNRMTLADIKRLKEFVHTDPRAESWLCEALWDYFYRVSSALPIEERFGDIVTIKAELYDYEREWLMARSAYRVLCPRIAERMNPEDVERHKAFRRYASLGSEMDLVLLYLDIQYGKAGAITTQFLKADGHPIGNLTCLGVQLQQYLLHALRKRNYEYEVLVKDLMEFAASVCRRATTTQVNPPKRYQ